MVNLLKNHFYYLLKHLFYIFFVLIIQNQHLTNSTHIVIIYIRRFIMKKHIKIILIVITVLAVCGVGLWFVFSRTKTETLPKTVNSFIEHTNTTDLHARLETSQELYKKHYNETRLNSLKDVLVKLDGFEQDLNVYLINCNAKAKSTKDLAKMYNDLSASRSKLIKDCDEYIVRMRGNTSAEGKTVKTLYNNLFNKVASYLYQYNTCFLNTSNYVFTHVAPSNNIKLQMYSLYSLGVQNLLDNISNNQFKELTTINHLNSLIKLDQNLNLVLKASVSGGEFNILALNFRKYYNSADKNDLITNFNSYYQQTINPNTETSNEKLAVYYLKQIVEA